MVSDPETYMAGPPASKIFIRSIIASGTDKCKENLPKKEIFYAPKETASGASRRRQKTGDPQGGPRSESGYRAAAVRASSTAAVVSSTMSTWPSPSWSMSVTVSPSATVVRQDLSSGWRFLQ